MLQALSLALALHAWHHIRRQQHHISSQQQHHISSQQYQQQQYLSTVYCFRDRVIAFRQIWNLIYSLGGKVNKTSNVERINWIMYREWSKVNRFYQEGRNTKIEFWVEQNSFKTFDFTKTCVSCWIMKKWTFFFFWTDSLPH